MQKSLLAIAQTNEQKKGSTQQGFGVMAGEVLRMNICAKFELWCFVLTLVL
jgi:hypothetical protein